MMYFHATYTNAIFALSLHDALPICIGGVEPQVVLGDRDAVVEGAHVRGGRRGLGAPDVGARVDDLALQVGGLDRSEEHTSELQSRGHLVCRLLLEKKNDYYVT